MHLQLTPPLTIRTKSNQSMDLLPVPMKQGFPSKIPGLWLAFLSPEKRVELDPDTLQKVQSYMARHGTEAVSADGLTAWTIAGDGLATCNPEVCGLVA